MAISSALGVAGAVPVGVVNPFAGATAPSGWLLCFGQAVSRSQYPVLFSVVSTTYGSGDGSTTFNLPDMRGRAVAGKDDMGGTAASRLTVGTSGITGTTLGNAGGDERVHLHTHANTVTNNTVTTGAGTAHTHSQNNFGVALSASGSYYSNGFVTGGAGVDAQGGGRGNGNESAHTHNVTSNVTISNANFGAGASQNVQPTIVLNYIIKAQ